MTYAGGRESGTQPSNSVSMNTPKQPENPFVFPFTPTDKSGQIGPTECGIQLRDYFAAKAMQAIVAATCNEFEGTEAAWVMATERVASQAFRISDAMLAERERSAK